MNKKGQSLALTVMGVIFVFIIGMLSAGFLLDEVTNARDNLSCSSATTISDGTKLLCLVMDVTIPWWIWMILAMAGGLIISRLAIG